MRAFFFYIFASTLNQINITMATETTTELTYGQKAVGVSFNPSQDPEVNKIKETTATAIDQMNDLRAKTTSPEVKRLASVAITELQTAQMWAVKALTWKD